MAAFRFGPQLVTTLTESAGREWLVADGCGGYAMGTVAGLRTRRYHGLLITSTGPPGRRQLGLAALDPMVEIGGSQVRLAVHEWSGGVIDPAGHELLESFALIDGVPRWRWSFGGLIVEREIAMARARPSVGVVHRVVAAPGPARITLSALCTWRDAHGERSGDGPPAQENLADGFAFENAYRVQGPGWSPAGTWYRGVRYREEAVRGLPDTEDLWYAGTFTAELSPGEALMVQAWAGAPSQVPPPAGRLVGAARDRARKVAHRCQPLDEADEHLAVAADQMIIEGPAVIAGYPWFGEWSRDTLTSYEGLFLETRRYGEGRALLERKFALLSEGLLPNTADTGSTEYNTADATFWLLHATGRHVEITGDTDLAATAVPHLEQVIGHHLAGTRHHIKADPADGLLAQGQEGPAPTC
jgi:predicted glycogen debranching enzyme